MAKKVAGDTYESIMRKLAEITRQVHQKNGYPYDEEALIRHLQYAVEGKFNTTVTPNSYLQKVDTAVVGSTKKNQTIADSQGVFAYIDADFNNWCLNKPSKNTKKGNLDVYEMQPGKDGDFSTLFGSLGNPDDLVVTQGQAIDFCENNRDKLPQGGYGAFFLIEDENGEKFVACVDVNDSDLGVDIFWFEGDDVWRGEHRHRLVVPQLET